MEQHVPTFESYVKEAKVWSAHEGEYQEPRMEYINDQKWIITVAADESHVLLNIDGEDMGKYDIDWYEDAGGTGPMPYFVYDGEKHVIEKFNLRVR